MDKNQFFTAEFAAPESATVARPAIRPDAVTLLPCPVGVPHENMAVGMDDSGGDAFNQDNSQTDFQEGAMNGSDEDVDPEDTCTAYQVAMSEGGSRKRRRVIKKSSKHRCRKCGHEYASEQWKRYHSSTDSAFASFK